MVRKMLMAATTMPALLSGGVFAQAAEVASGEGAAEGLVTIVVTAQRREVDAQEVSAAVSVVSGAQLMRSGVETANEIATVVPNVNISPGLAIVNPPAYIRGVGNNDFNANASSPIGTYIDDVYIGSGSAVQFQLFDTARVEVLRGPQGTLYGRNTTGGAINYISRDPGDDFEGYARVRYGTFDEVGAEAAATLPLAETLSLRVAGTGLRRDGLTFNRYYGEDVPDTEFGAGRAKLRFQPNEALDMILNVHGGTGRATENAQMRGTQDPANIANPCPIADAVAFRCVNRYGYGDFDGDLYAGAYDKRGRETVDTVGASLRVNYDFGAAVLTSITSYDEINRDTFFDADHSPFDLITINYRNRSTQWSQELRLASPGGARFNWLAGAYFYDEDLGVNNDYDYNRVRRVPPDFAANPAAAIQALNQSYDQTDATEALFGRADFRPIDALKLEAGLRYTRERRTLSERVVREPGLVEVTLVDVDRRTEDSAVSGDVVVTYELSDDMRVYGSIARGFKSGGVNGGLALTPVQVSEFDPEYVTSYELGLKSELLDHNLRLNLAGFYYDYEDMQLFTLMSNGTTFVPVLDNAGTAEIYGLEAELVARLSHSLSINAAAGWLHSELTQFITQFGQNYSGNELPYAPHFTGSLGAEFEQQLGADLLLTARADVSYRSNAWYSVVNNPRLKQLERTLVNARLDLARSGGAWTVSLWAKNLFDEHYISNITDVSAFGHDNVFVGLPRMYGVELQYDF